MPSLPKGDFHSLSLPNRQQVTLPSVKFTLLKLSDFAVKHLRLSTETLTTSSASSPPVPSISSLVVSVSVSLTLYVSVSLCLCLCPSLSLAFSLSVYMLLPIRTHVEVKNQRSVPFSIILQLIFLKHGLSSPSIHGDT